jgi:hypothetical protein
MNPRLIAPLVVFLSSAPAFASRPAPARYICAATVDCGSPGLPSTQDLPAVSTPTVVSRSVEDARTDCVSKHTSAYLRLARSIDEVTPTNALKAAPGCKIVSEAFLER